MRRYLLLLIMLGAAFAHADVTGRVVAVTDGDTIKALNSDQVQHKVRLTGIDAPERGQPFGTVSRNHLASLVAGKEVRWNPANQISMAACWARCGCSRLTVPPVARPSIQTMPSYWQVWLGGTGTTPRPNHPKTVVGMSLLRMKPRSGTGACGQSRTRSARMNGGRENDE